MAYKTYKIDLSKEQEKFLKQNKKKNGLLISWQLTEAVKMYINSLK